MTAKVQFSIKSADGQFNFTIENEIIVGRDPSCSAVVTQQSLSRRHARLFIEEENLFVEDLGSANGTYVNGERLGEGPKGIRYNDALRFDVVEFTVFVELLGQEKEAEKEVPASAEPESKTEEQEPHIPKSWAVNEEVGHGTVVMNLGKAAPEQPQPVSDAALEDALNRKLHYPALIGLQGADKAKVIDLKASGVEATVWRLGRGGDMDIVINNPSVSEQQAQIIHGQGSWKLVDLISTNDTCVNGEKILTHYLANGDIISLGPVDYRFRTTGRTDFSPKTNTSSSGHKPPWLVIGAVAVVVIAGLAYFLMT